MPLFDSIRVSKLEQNAPYKINIEADRKDSLRVDYDNFETQKGDPELIRLFKVLVIQEASKLK